MVYAFIQEELLYNSINKPELRSATLFVDSSHNQAESLMIQRSARLEIEKEYIDSMRPQAVQLYLYSFHPHTPIQSVCSRIVKAIRGRKSESVRIIPTESSVDILSRACKPTLSLDRAKHRKLKSSDGSLRLLLLAELLFDGINS